MFKELVPVLRDRAVLITAVLVENDEVRVNIIPQKTKDGENTALTTPLTVTAAAEDLDRELGATVVSFVGTHLQLKNTLAKAKEEMDAAAKAAQAEAKAKAKTGKKEPAKSAASASPDKPETAKSESGKPEPAKSASLFDFAPTTKAEPADEEEILAEVGEQRQTEDEDEDEELDEAA